MDFIKYQGTGNDFIIVDGRNGSADPGDVQQLCDRRFGIGADGLMLLENEEGYDFRMIYYNSDGRLSSMCGNGGRCLAHFAHSLGLGQNGKLRFIATDGEHTANVNGNHVSLSMIDVQHIERRGDDVFILNTGSPHYVKFTTGNPDTEDLTAFAKAIRYSAEFSAEGININLVQVVSDGHIKMRTYERGVEDETLSCGTGVTAAALAFQLYNGKNTSPVKIATKGGNLTVESVENAGGFSGIVLAGPAVPVFKGTV